MQQRVEKDGGTSKSVAEELFHCHAPAIFAFLRRQTSSREDAEDILLEVFTAVIEQKSLGLLPQSQQRQLIWKIARNKLVDAYRRSMRRPSSSIELLQEDQFADDEQAPEQELLRLEEYALLHNSFALIFGIAHHQFKHGLVGIEALEEDLAKL